MSSNTTPPEVTWQPSTHLSICNQPVLKKCPWLHTLPCRAAQPGCGRLLTGMVKPSAGAHVVGVTRRGVTAHRPLHIPVAPMSARGWEHREAVVPLTSLSNTGSNRSKKKYSGVWRQGGIIKVLRKNIPFLVFALPQPLELALLSGVLQEWVSLLCTRGRCLMVCSYNHSLLFTQQSNNEKFPCYLPMK